MVFISPDHKALLVFGGVNSLFGAIQNLKKQRFYQWSHFDGEDGPPQKFYLPGSLRILGELLCDRGYQLYLGDFHHSELRTF